MKNTLITFFFLSIFLISCNDDNDPSPNNNNNGGGGGNNSGCSGGPSTVTDIDGNTYNVVTIGNQCWMKENLKATRYRNGDSIPGNLGNAAWKATTHGAQADDRNDPANTVIYGKLYNWYAVSDPRGLCPTDWHVPSDAEWNQLVKYLDPDADIDSYPQSTIAGGMLKATGTLQAGTGLWESPNFGATNLSGFTGLPCNPRGSGGGFGLNGSGSGWWWSSTQTSPTNCKARFLFCNNSEVNIIYASETSGYSVRCVRD